MFFYATESFRNARGLPLTGFAEMMGMSFGMYNNRRQGATSLNPDFKELFRNSTELFESERELIKEIDRLDQDSAEDVRRFKEKVGEVRVEVQRELNQDSPHRIQNLPEFYTILKELEDHTCTYKLHGVEPNDPRLQKLRRMMGENEVWNNPETSQARGAVSLAGTKDRRGLADTDTRYTTGLRVL